MKGKRPETCNYSGIWCHL